jgi:hypothetical protein
VKAATAEPLVLAAPIHASPPPSPAINQSVCVNPTATAPGLICMGTEHALESAGHQLLVLAARVQRPAWIRFGGGVPAAAADWPRRRPRWLALHLFAVSLAAGVSFG